MILVSTRLNLNLIIHSNRVSQKSLKQPGTLYTKARDETYDILRIY